MTAAQSIERHEGLAVLVGHLAGAEFGGSPACAEVDPELFFPVSESAEGQIAAAKRICAGCPIQVSCLQQAMGRAEHGIWGGATEDERRRLRTARLDQDQQDIEITEGVQAA